MLNGEIQNIERQIKTKRLLLQMQDFAIVLSGCCIKISYNPPTISTPATIATVANIIPNPLFFLWAA